MYIIIDVLAWIGIAFFVASWTQNIAALIIAHLRYSIFKNIEQDAEAGVIGVSIIKPLMGWDNILYHNLETWFKIDYPLFEIIFCVQHPDDTAIPVVLELMKNYPQVNAKLVISGTVPATVIFKNGDLLYLPSSNVKSDEVVNPKVKNLLHAYEYANYEYIFLSDCYIEAERDSIQDVVSQMRSGVGSVCQLHFVRDADEPDLKTFGSIVNKVLFGTHNAKSILFLNFMKYVTTVSAAMLIRKSALEECGGLRAFGCFLAEDFQIGLALAKRGWKNVMGKRLAWQNPATTHVEDVFSRIIRWKKLRQNSAPILLIAEPMAECLTLAVVMPYAVAYLSGAGLMFPFWSFASTHIIAWFFVDYFLLSTLNGQPLQFSKVTFLIAWLTRELASPWLQLASVSNRLVTWKNQHFYLRLGGITESLSPVENLNSSLSISSQSFSSWMSTSPRFFAVKSYTSTPSTEDSGCIIDFVKGSPIEQKQVLPILGGKLNFTPTTESRQPKVTHTPFNYWPTALNN